MNNMTGILMRFREDTVGAQGDITKIYHMIRFPDAHRALTEDTYVDNVLVVKPTLEEIKITIEQIELVSAKGGFFFKQWIISGQNLPHQVIQVTLPNAISFEEEKALGINWHVLGICSLSRLMLCLVEAGKVRRLLKY